VGRIFARKFNLADCKRDIIKKLVHMGGGRTRRRFAVYKILVLLAVLILTVSCENGENAIPVNTGDLGSGTFDYECVNSEYDAACLWTMEPSWPRSIAIGADFDLEFVSNKGTAAREVVGGSPNHILNDYDSMQLIGEGQAVVLALNGSDEVVDLIHVVGKPVALLELGVLPGGNDAGWYQIEQVEVEVGESLRLRPIPQDDNGRILAGAVEYSWVVDDELTVAIDVSNPYSSIYVEGLLPGSTFLTVAAGDVVQQYDVVVTGVAVDTDSGTDTGADTDTDTDTN